METLLDFWSLGVVLLAAFVIGWGAETAQLFVSRALALGILAWLQTAPEFAVEADIAWHQQRDLMIANLTGSLRLIVGLGLPMILFVNYFSHGAWKNGWRFRVRLHQEDSLGVLSLFFSLLYFIPIYLSRKLSVLDSAVLIGIYLGYLYLSSQIPVQDLDESGDLPWVTRKILTLNRRKQIAATVGLFSLGGIALYFAVHPFIQTLQRWSLTFGISTFVFVQWVAPFLSEFPEKVTAFHWARQKKKAPMAVMNMVSSNINQWTVLAAMIPIVFSLSLGKVTPLNLDDHHAQELLLTILQSLLSGLLLLDLEFSLFDALAIFLLWLVQFIYSDLRSTILLVYAGWCAVETLRLFYQWFGNRRLPHALTAFSTIPWKRGRP